MLKENLWNLLTSPDFDNVKIGIAIYEGNPDFKDVDIDGYIKLVKYLYIGWDAQEWGSLEKSRGCEFSWSEETTEVPKYFDLLPIHKLEFDFMKIKNLPKYPLLKTISCNFAKIKSLPEYPLLEELSCFFSEIQHIPYYPNLRFFYGEQMLVRWYNNEYGTNF